MIMMGTVTWDIVGYNVLAVTNAERYSNHDPRDNIGYGTHVAGIIAAVGNNGADGRDAPESRRRRSVESFQR